MKGLFRRKYNKKGFTLAELLIGLGILSILILIGTIGVISYQKKLKLIELDGIARQIFVTAQNKITIAKESGKWDELEHKYNGMSDPTSYFGELMEEPSDYLTHEEWPEGGKNSEHEYRYLVYDGNPETLENTALSVILPLGAIDEGVRSEGRYIIEYDYKTATVYGVFYTDNHEGIRYTSDITGANGLNPLGGRADSSDGKSIRRNYKNASGKSLMIGYYGGATTTTLTSIDLTATTVEVSNGNKLEVTIKDTNYNRVVDGIKVQSKVSLTLTGEDSGQSATRILSYDSTVGASNSASWWRATREGDTIIYKLTIDDITTKGGQFASLFPELWAGENIIITVEVFSNDVLSKPCKTMEYTNSLFGAKYTNETGGETVHQITIGAVRHLQNLSPTISNLFGNKQDDVMEFWSNLKVEQTKTLDWVDFVNDIGSNPTIYGYHSDASAQSILAIDQFYSIDNQVIIAYEGNNNSIKNLSIKEDASGNAGIFSNFGGVAGHMTIKDVVLESVTSTSTKDGAHTGTLIGGVGWTLSLTVENILVKDSIVNAKGGYSGSIIGYIESGSDGAVTINNLVSINPTVTMYGGNAGGLIGFMSKGTVTNCSVYLTDTNTSTSAEKYQQGAFNSEYRTVGGVSIDIDDMTSRIRYQVYSGHGLAGGLIGQVDGTTIQDCFSAIPVITKNGVAGGFIAKTATYGEIKDVVISNSYVGGYTIEGEYSSYQNIVSTNGTAGGFLGEASYKGRTTISNSYTTASVYGDIIGGFVGEVKEGTTVFKDSYNTGKITSSNATAGTDITCGGMAGAVQWGNMYVENSYYLKDTNKDSYFTTFVPGENSIGYEDLKTIYGTNTKKENHSYDETLKEEEYPFKMVTKTSAMNDGNSDKDNYAHYGDWPLQLKTTEFDTGLLYYEVIDGQIYYHGYLAKYVSSESDISVDTYKEIFTQSDHEALNNGLVTESEKYVTEDGYLVVVPKDTNPSKVLMSIGDGKANDQNKLTLASCAEKFNKERFQSERLEQLEEYDFYYFTAEDKVAKRTYITLGEQKSPQDEWSFGDHVSFSFYPKFADSIFKIAYNGESYNPDEKTYYIRSARQLSNMQNSPYVNDWSAQDITLKQTLDISYDGVSFTKNGVRTSYTYNTVWNLWADYIAEKNSNNKGYIIKGLDRVFFNVVESVATVQGITLLNSDVNGGDRVACLVIYNNGTIVDSFVLNSKVSGGNEVAGFVVSNNGIIESCGVRSEYANYDGYNQIQIKGSGNVAGFVYQNGWAGIIENSYFIGTVSGQNASGFIFENNQTVENSYANALVTADYSASGFVDYINSNNTIKNSFVVGRVTSNYGNAYGFMRTTNWNAVVENCYSALFGLSGNQVMLFGEGLGSNFSNCWWLENQWVTSSVKNDTEKGSKITYDELYAKGNKPITHKYGTGYDNTDTESKVYPFELLTGSSAYSALEFYGDWPEKPEIIEAEYDVGVLYYEVIDSKLYYHGYTAKFSPNESTPEYKEVKTEGKNLQNGLVIEKNQYVTEDGYVIAVPKGTDPTKLVVAVGEGKTSSQQKWTLSEVGKPFAHEELLPLEGVDIYYITKDFNQWDLNYITFWQSANGVGGTPMEGYVSFSFDPYFADSIFPTKVSRYYIRSTRHLQSLSTRTWSLANRSDITFVQNLDISYDDVIITKNGEATAYPYETLEQIMADYISETITYEGITRGYIIKGLDKPLFGTINNLSTVKGVTLINSKTVGRPAFAEYNGGTIESCAVRSELPISTGYDNVSVTNIQDSGGFIKSNSGTIRNSYFVGSVSGDRVAGFADTNQGTIEYCYANAIVNGAVSASGFIRYNNGGTMKETFAVGSVVSENGTAYGFMEEGNSGTMENCYSALFKISGINIYLFGPGRGNNYNNCVWLEHSWIEGEVQQGNPNDTYERGVSKTYKEMASEGTSPLTYKYNSGYENIDTTTKVYPFKLIFSSDAYTPISFWGDWPKVEESSLQEEGM